MAYSKIGIINLALGKIGVARISSLTEDSAQCIKAVEVYDYILDEVLESADWRFAKRRVALSQSTTAPANTNQYDYAYPLPQDYLRTAKGTKSDPAVYPVGAYALSYTSLNALVQAKTYDYIIEALEDGTKCLFTNYDNSSEDLYLTYIRRVTNPGLYSAQFISALSFRLAAEVSMSLTESVQKFELMMNGYDRALLLAKGHNQSMDYLEDEHGGDEWESAGR